MLSEPWKPEDVRVFTCVIFLEGQRSPNKQVHRAQVVDSSGKALHVIHGPGHESGRM